jgi:hypothetical protein
MDYRDVVRQTRLRRQRSEVRRLEHTLTFGAWMIYEEIGRLKGGVKAWNTLSFRLLDQALILHSQ